MTLTFRRTWPDEPGPDYVLERARDGEPPETIGRVMEHARTNLQTAGWVWSLTCARAFVGVPKPAFDIKGFAVERQDAADALKAAWAREEAWRAHVLATVDLSGMPPDVRRHMERGVPEPAKPRALGEGDQSDPISA